MGSVVRSDVLRVRVRVPAKVNLFLAVRGRRPDGYHELVSVMQTVGIHDALEASMPRALLAGHPVHRRSVSVDLEVEDGVDLPRGEDNLAVRAARAVMRAVGLGGEGGGAAPDGHTMHLRLAKRIPVAAGMAGGSADAAAALLAVNRLWEGPLERDRLLAIAADLGADVPFCVGGGTALATGTGTATAQVLTRGTFHWVVGIDAHPLSTADVYRAHDEVGRASRVEPDVVLQALRTGDAALLGAALHNDLEAAAFHLRPDLRDRRDALVDAGALGAVLSGSGPTVLGLGRDREHAEELADRTRSRFARVEVAASPAGGPDVGLG